MLKGSFTYKLSAEPKTTNCTTHTHSNGPKIFPAIAWPAAAPLGSLWKPRPPPSSAPHNPAYRLAGLLASELSRRLAGGLCQLLLGLNHQHVVLPIGGQLGDRRLHQEAGEDNKA